VDRSLELDPHFIKAYYRRGIARLALGKYKLALHDFRAVARLRPTDTTAQEKMKQCEKILRLEAFEAAIRAEDQETIISCVKLISYVNNNVAIHTGPGQPHCLAAAGV
jgi:serine/threonine-protein phosphatase 5